MSSIQLLVFNFKLNNYLSNQPKLTLIFAAIRITEVYFQIKTFTCVSDNF